MRRLGTVAVVLTMLGAITTGCAAGPSAEEKQEAEDATEYQQEVDEDTAAITAKLDEIEAARATSLENDIYPAVGEHGSDKSGEMQPIVDLKSSVNSIPDVLYDPIALTRYLEFVDANSPDARDKVLETEEFNITALRQSIAKEMPSIQSLKEDPETERARIDDLLTRLDQELAKAPTLGAMWPGGNTSQLIYTGAGLLYRMSDGLGVNAVDIELFRGQSASDAGMDNEEQAAYAEQSAIVLGYRIDYLDSCEREPKTCIDESVRTLSAYSEQVQKLNRFFPEGWVRPES